MENKKTNVAVLDLDGTVVPEMAYFPLIAAVAVTVAYPFGISWAIVAVAWIVSTLVRVCPLPLETDNVYVNTARPWPLVSPVTLVAIGVPFDRVYFRSAWKKEESKVQNMDAILRRSGAPKRCLLTLYDNDKANVAAVRQAGYQGVLVEYTGKCSE